LLVHVDLPGHLLPATTLLFAHPGDLALPVAVAGLSSALVRTDRRRFGGRLMAPGVKSCGFLSLSAIEKS